MEGIVTVSGTTMTMTSDVTGGSGTFTVWTISVAGDQGVTGATGPTGVTGITVTGPTAPANTAVLWADTSTTGVAVIPAGGTTSQVLAKSSATDYATGWVDPTPVGGLVYITSTTAATSATMQINNCFTSTYDNYLIVFTGYSLSANDYFYYRLVDGTTPDTATNYNTDRMEQYSTTVAGLELLNTNAAYVGQGYGTTTGYFHGQVTLFEPQVARRTASYGTFMSKGSGSLVTTTTSCLMGVTTQYEGIQFFTNVGSTFNGTFTVYGYRK